MNGSQRKPAKTRIPSAVAALLVPDDNADDIARRQRARPLLPPVFATRVEHAVDDELVRTCAERDRIASGTSPQRPQTEPVDERVREAVGRLGERERVGHQHQASRPLRTRERVDVSDVADRVGKRPGARDVVRHRSSSAPIAG